MYEYCWDNFGCWDWQLVYNWLFGQQQFVEWWMVQVMEDVFGWMAVQGGVVYWLLVENGYVCYWDGCSV